MHFVLGAPDRGQGNRSALPTPSVGFKTQRGRRPGELVGRDLLTTENNPDPDFS